MDISFGEIADTILRLQDATSVSLPQFTKPATIESPCFIQDTLFDDPDIINDVITNLYNIYTGYVLTALQMNDLVVGNRRVRDVLGTVSTSSLFTAKESFVDTNAIADIFGTTEAVKASSTSQPHRILNVKDIPPIASGRTIELKFNTANGDPITVMVNMRFNSRAVPSEVMQYVVESNFSLDIYKRYLQVRAGEISFVKDFIFNVDKLLKRAKALKKDSSNALSDILRNQNKGNLRSSFKLLHLLGANRSYNLANAVLLFDENDILPIAKKSGLDFFKVRDRRKFFDTTFALFVVLIDNRYSKIHIFTNGIDDVSTLSFSDLRRAASSDKVSLRDVMDNLSKNMTPKF